jgi:hypothetical protein
MSPPRKPKAAPELEAHVAPELEAHVFKLRDDGQEDGVKHVSLGSTPRVSLALGETFTTTDARLAARLARDPHLEEVKS